MAVAAHRLSQPHDRPPTVTRPAPDTRISIPQATIEGLTPVAPVFVTPQIEIFVPPSP